MLGPTPLLSGPAEVVEGYYELERAERSQAQDTLNRHASDVGLWYHLLTLHRQAFLQGFHFTCPDDELPACQARMQFLALGLISSKAALDALLVGYYSAAFALIRHMGESWACCRYVEYYPDQAHAFYAPKSGALASPPEPKMQTVIKKLKQRHKGDKEATDAFEQIYQGWTWLSAGAHPSGIGIVQTVGQQPGHGVLGATYHAGLSRDGFTKGLPAAKPRHSELVAGSLPNSW